MSSTPILPFQQDDGSQAAQQLKQLFGLPLVDTDPVRSPDDRKSQQEPAGFSIKTKPADVYEKQNEDILNKFYSHQIDEAERDRQQKELNENFSRTTTPDDIDQASKNLDRAIVEAQFAKDKNTPRNIETTRDSLPDHIESTYIPKEESTGLMSNYGMMRNLSDYVWSATQGSEQPSKEQYIQNLKFFAFHPEVFGTDDSNLAQHMYEQLEFQQPKDIPPEVKQLQQVLGIAQPEQVQQTPVKPVQAAEATKKVLNSNVESLATLPIERDDTTGTSRFWDAVTLANKVNEQGPALVDPYVEYRKQQDRELDDYRAATQRVLDRQPIGNSQHPEEALMKAIFPEAYTKDMPSLGRLPTFIPHEEYLEGLDAHDKLKKHLGL
jgi:hypothetical protein